MTELNAKHRRAIWAALSALSRQHRAFPDAKWALPDRDLAQIQELVERLEPIDPVAKFSYLFAEPMPDLGTTRTDFAAYDAALGEKRREAIRDIVEAGGLTGIELLLDAAQQAFAIGWSVSDSAVAIPAEQVLKYLDSADQHRAAYAFGYACQRSNKDGLAWVDEILKALVDRPVAQARVLRATRVFPDSWERATNAGREVEAAFWQEFVPLGLGPNFRWLNEAAEKLLEHGRPAAAVTLLALYGARNDPPGKPEVAAEALEALIGSSSDELRRVSPYDLQQLLELLRQANFEVDRLALLEWRLLPGLGYGTPAPTLERQLARSPKFFVEILSLCFKRDDGTTEEQPAPEVAQNAFHLLQDWRVVPGSAERGGTVDDAKLREWLEGALARLREVHRVKIGSVYIGHVFAQAKADDDGTWPTRPIRDAIERLASDDVDQGFGTQIYNNRGVTSRSLTAGGQQERELADKFEKWETKIRDRWPRTAAILRSIGDGYRAQGQTQDEEAERFKKGIDPF